MKTCLKSALDHKFYHLDSAQVYENEKYSGEAIQEWLKANPSIKREDLFITSKVSKINQ